ncbi:MAG: TOPRIM nucleotidyl transferase/hydrolase domain-containing protein [Nocardioidaceae bacterium]
MTARAVVLVEGLSDRLAVEALAQRRGRDLAAEGVTVVAMGGATNIGSYLERFGPRGLDVAVAGLCDEAEALVFQRNLERAGFGSNLTRAEMEDHRFFVCVEDLEDELIGALGVAAVEKILAAQGELKLFRLFQQQPAQHGKSDRARLRRFMGTRSGRKIRYAPLLVRALDLAHVPAPLDRLIAHV